MAALAADGIVIGRSTRYFATSLVHETGHVIDGTFAPPPTARPRAKAGPPFRPPNHGAMP